MSARIRICDGEPNGTPREMSLPKAYNSVIKGEIDVVSDYRDIVKFFISFRTN